MNAGKISLKCEMQNGLRQGSCEYLDSGKGLIFKANFQKDIIQKGTFEK